MHQAKTILYIILLSCLLSSCDSDSTASSKSKALMFNDVYEPSGVIQLFDGQILIVEDEKDHPFSLLTLKPDNTFQAATLSTTAPIYLDDLEGLTQGNDHWIYAISSHSRLKNGQHKLAREQLVRFHIKQHTLSDYQVAAPLSDMFKRIFPKKKLRRKLNIEGLAYDFTQNDLLLGLRAPRLEGKAQIIRIKNPEVLFASNPTDALETELIALDLKGNSIRALEYDPVLQGYLLVAGSEKSRDKPFRLWLWKANKLHRMKISGIKNIGYTEGISSIKDTQNRPMLLLVQDDGQRGKVAGHYMLLSYEQITF